MTLTYTGERNIPKLGFGKGQEVLYEMCSTYTVDNFVLDIACGVGWGTEILARKAKYVIGADVSPEAIDYARNEYNRDNISYCVGDILQIPFTGGLFDTLVSVETIEHVPHCDIYKLISECSRVLKPNGTFVFTTPNHDIYPYHPKNKDEFKGYHFWHYSADELLKILKTFFNEIKIEKPGSLFVVCKK